jgi:FkbM family methyltransferase
MDPLVIAKKVLDCEAGRRQPASVLARFAGWQLWRRVFRKPLTFATVTGSRLILVPGASDSISGFWYQQLPDFEEMAFALHALHPGDLFVDIGANQGGWSLMVAGRGAQVLAFEPVPVTRARLLANVAANSASVRGRIRVSELALGETAGQARFTADLDAANRRIGEDEAARGDVIVAEVGCADDALRDEEPAVIKIDVEGGELGVLRGAGAVLGKPSLFAVIMETFRPANYAQPQLIAAEQILRGHGFLPVAYDPWKRDIRPISDPAEGGQNTIYVRELDTVRAQVKMGGRIRAFGTRV